MIIDSSIVRAVAASQANQDQLVFSVYSSFYRVVKNGAFVTRKISIIAA